MSQKYYLIVLLLEAFYGATAYIGYGVIKLRTNSSEQVEEFKHFLTRFPDVGEEIEFMGANSDCIIKVPFLQQQLVEDGLAQLKIPWESLVAVTKVERPSASKGITGREKKQPEGSAEHDEFPIFNRIMYKIIDGNQGAVVNPKIYHEKVKGIYGGITFENFQDINYLHDFYFELISKVEGPCNDLMYFEPCIRVTAWLKPVKKINDYGIRFLQKGSKFNAYFDKKGSDTVTVDSRKYGLAAGSLNGRGVIPFGHIVFANSNLKARVLKVASYAESKSYLHKTIFTNLLDSTPRVVSHTRVSGKNLNEVHKLQRLYLREILQFDKFSTLFTTSSYDDSDIFPDESEVIEVKGYSKCTLFEGVASYSYNSGINITISLDFGEISFLNKKNKVERRPLFLDDVLLRRGFDEYRKVYKLPDPNTFLIEYKRPSISGLVLPFRILDCSSDTTLEYPLCKKIERD